MKSRSFRILFFFALIYSIFMQSCLTTRYYYELSKQGFSQLEELVGSEYIWLDNDTPIEKASSIDTANIYILKEVNIDKKNPIACKFVFEKANDKKEFEIAVISSKNENELLDKYLICIDEYDKSFKAIDLKSVFNINMDYAIKTVTSEWVIADSYLFAKGFHPVDRFEMNIKKVLKEQADEMIKMISIENNKKLASLYGVDDYVYFIDILKKWNKLLIVKHGELPDGGWEYPTSNAVFLMPVSKVTIKQGYEENVFFLEYNSNDYNVHSPWGYEYYKRFVIKDSHHVIDVVNVKTIKTANMGTITDYEYKITKPFLLKVIGRTTIQYQNGNRQWVYLFETIPFNKMDPNFVE